MNESSLPTAHAPSSARPLFGGSPAVSAAQLKAASDTLAAACINDEALTYVSDTINLSMGLLRALDPVGAREAMRDAQAPLLAAYRAAEVAEQNRAAAKSAGLRPVFLEPPAQLPSDAGAVTPVGVAIVVGVVLLLCLLVIFFGGPKADARALDGREVEAVRVQPAESHPRPKCAPTYWVSVDVRVKERRKSGGSSYGPDGRFHAAVWLQERYERPRFNRVTRRWEYFRARLVGTGVSDSPVVRVSGCVDPSRVDGRGGPIYLILNDIVDDDQDAAGRIRRGTVRVRFVEGRGWKVSR